MSFYPYLCHFKVKQIRFVDWPDHGVPDDPSHFLEFLFRINKLKNELDLEKPTIVHCSAGVGRTGVTISLDYALENIRNILENDPIKILIKMRQQRPCLVQDWFVIVWDCFDQILSRPY